MSEFTRLGFRDRHALRDFIDEHNSNCDWNQRFKHAEECRAANKKGQGHSFKCQCDFFDRVRKLRIETMKLLTREEFKQKVFQRDNNVCIVCQAPAVDAHHLIERKLFSDNGYYLDNGVSVCGKHHLLAEQTILSCDELRKLANIKSIVLPPDFSAGSSYDKWGNTIQSNGKRVRGPLFDDCEQILRSSGLLHLFF